MIKPTAKTQWNGTAVMKDLNKSQFRSLFEGANLVLNDAVANVTTDLGQLRQSLTKEVKPTRATVGTNVIQAPFIEFGTRPHVAPIKALQGWADRHGVPVGAVWTSIKRKGTKAQPFLLPALTGNIRKIIAIFAKNNINLKWVHR